MARLTPRFSANRAVCEYTGQHYLSAAAAYRRRVADKGAMGVQLLELQRSLARDWSNLRFGEMTITTDGENHLFEIQVYLDDLSAEAVRVELYADGVNGGEAFRQEMNPVRQLVGANGALYGAQIPMNRPASDYTARVIPRRDGAAVPLEAGTGLPHSRTLSR